VCVRVQATSFYDHMAFLVIFVYFKDGDTTRRKRLGWLFRLVGSHDPESDCQHIALFFAIVQAVLTLFGVPVCFQPFMHEFSQLIVDNENSNTGVHSGLGVRINRRGRRELRWMLRWRLVPAHSRYVATKLQGCHYHIVNCVDKLGSSLWRVDDVENGLIVPNDPSYGKDKVWYCLPQRAAAFDALKHSFALPQLCSGRELCALQLAVLLSCDARQHRVEGLVQHREGGRHAMATVCKIEILFEEQECGVYV
jgi:hypothetical protein